MAGNATNANSAGITTRSPRNPMSDLQRPDNSLWPFIALVIKVGPLEIEFCMF